MSEIIFILFLCVFFKIYLAAPRKQLDSKSNPTSQSKSNSNPSSIPKQNTNAQLTSTAINSITSITTKKDDQLKTPQSPTTVSSTTISSTTLNTQRRIFLPGQC